MLLDALTMPERLLLGSVTVSDRRKTEMALNDVSRRKADAQRSPAGGGSVCCDKRLGLRNELKGVAGRIVPACATTYCSSLAKSFAAPFMSCTSASPQRSWGDVR